MPHAIWKGAISFGLVHIPVAVYPAASEIGIDFDWLDKRSMDPVGYKRVNKRTGREIAKEHIVKGVKVEGGDYVIVSEDEIHAAYPKTTRTIEIESFVAATDIPFTQLEKPYYLEPAAGGDKVYALLREAMFEAGVIGIARVVMHTRESLAAVIPAGRGLVLNTLRWAQEIRPWTGLKLPAAGRKALKAGELEMAADLIGNMTSRWKPDAHAERFTEAIHALVAKRAKAGRTETVEPVEDVPDGGETSNVVDLTALLRQSLGQRGGKGSSGRSKASSSRSTSRSSAAKSRRAKAAARQSS